MIPRRSDTRLGRSAEKTHVGHRLMGKHHDSRLGRHPVTALTFAGGVAGLFLQRLLPDEHSAEKSRDMIGAVMGLVTLLLALVLGTIVGSAYFFSATQQSELQGLSAQWIQIDEALAQFGPRRSAYGSGRLIWLPARRRACRRCSFSGSSG